MFKYTLLHKLYPEHILCQEVIRMYTLKGILMGAPLWAWVILLYGLIQGWKSLRDHVIDVKKSIVMALFFIYLGISSLFKSLNLFPGLGLIWVFTGFLGFYISYYFLVSEPEIIEKRQSYIITAKGSPLFLIIFPIIFITKFTYSVFMVTNPTLLENLSFLGIFFIVKGLCTGIMLGRTGKNLIYFYHKSNRKVLV